MQNTSDMLSDASKQVEKDVQFLTSAKTWKNLTQNQIISGLTVILLVVGVVTGVYLGQSGQDVRQQASSTYPRCTNTTGDCANALADGTRACNVGGGVTGICTNTESSGLCTCAVQNFNVCTTGAATCIGKTDGASCGTVQNPRHCDMTVNATQQCSCVDDATTPTPGQCVSAGGACSGSDYARAECCNNSNNVDSLFCYTGSCLTCIPDGESVNQNTPIRPGGGSYCCNGVCEREPINGLSQFYCCQGGGPVNTSTPIPTAQPTSPPPNPCLNTHEEVDPTCGTNGCGSCDQSVTLRGSDNLTHCGHICRQNPSCPGCAGVTPPLATNTPALTLSPTNTPVIGPICVNVTMNNPATATAGTPPSIGHVVTLSCSPVTGATRYEFRVRQPDNTLFEVNPSVSVPTTSEAFQISMAGNYAVECRACATTSDSSCSPWQSGL